MSIKVLEIGGYAAGYFGRLFARQGAEVTRLELEAESAAWASSEAMHLFLHEGKKSVAFKNAAEVVDYAGAVDVVVCEAESANALDALRFDDWQTNIKVAITPFGRTGPKRNWQASPSTLLAMGGYTFLMGDPERAPLNLPGHYLEFQTGAIAYSAAVASIFADQSDTLDVSMLETVLSLTQFTHVRWHCARDIRQRHGNDFYFVVPSNLFKTQDSGWVYINIVPAFWDAFTVFIEMPELLIDERFATNDLRIKHRDALYKLAVDVIASWTTEACVRRAEAARIPLGVVQTFDDVLKDPHLVSRDFWETVVCKGNDIVLPRGGYQLRDPDNALMSGVRQGAAARSKRPNL